MKKNILAAELSGFQLKHLHQLDTSMFAYFFPNELFLSAGQKQCLLSDGFDMESWSKGERLSYNNKYASLKKSLAGSEILGQPTKRKQHDG